MRRWLLILVGLVLVGYLLTGVTEVRPGERAVIRRFGRVLDEKPGPGLWVGLPWGMDRVDRISVETVRRVTVGYQPDTEENGPPPGQLLTGDQNLVNVQVVIDYTVREAEVADFVVQQERVDGLVSRVTESVLAEWVGGREVDDVLLHGKGNLPDHLPGAVQARVEPYHLGIEVGHAQVGYLFPPDEVKSAFDDVARAQAGIRTRINQAEQDAERRLREARSEQYRLEQLASAYAVEQRLQAKADAERFERRLEKYQALRRDNPAYLKGIWLDEIGRLFGRMKENGQVDLLDQHLSGDGLDLTIIQAPKKK